MASFAIAETETFEKKINTPQFRSLYRKITDYVYPILRANPFYGPNIKKLKGDYKDIYRYRIGDYRIFYTISEETVIVFVVGIEARKDAYR